MKCRIFLIFCLGITLFFPSLCLSESPNPKIWKPLSTSYYYNKTIITKAPGILLVWTYKMVTDDIRMKRMEELKKYDPDKSSKYESFHHETFLWQMDCPGRKIRMEEYIEFDKDGKVLDRYRYQNPEWQTVYPKTGGNELLQTVCFPSKEPLKKNKRMKSGSVPVR
jgi:hypothetical protein